MPAMTPALVAIETGWTAWESDPMVKGRREGVFS
jgi:hypothetical protein